MQAVLVKSAGLKRAIIYPEEIEKKCSVFSAENVIIKWHP